MRETVIVSAVRTPTGKFLGGLKDFKATELGALVVREAVRRAGVDPATVDECILGNVVSAGGGQAPARQAALNGGLDIGVGDVRDREEDGCVFRRPDLFAWIFDSETQLRAPPATQMSPTP